MLSIHYQEALFHCHSTDNYDAIGWLFDVQNHVLPLL